MTKPDSERKIIVLKILSQEIEMFFSYIFQERWKREKVLWLDVLSSKMKN